MDPGVMVLLAGLCKLFGSGAAGITIIGGAKHAVSGGLRDNSALISHVTWGSIATALIFTAPFYLPALVNGALMLMRWVV